MSADQLLEDEARFWTKVEVIPGGCWVWTAAISGCGYGSFRLSAGGQKRTVLTHRYSWEMLVGLIPPNLELDHLCRNQACVNPDHLEPVTKEENVRRGMTRSGNVCRRNHVGQWKVSPDGRRRCIECRRDRLAARQALDTGFENWTEGG